MKVEISKHKQVEEALKKYKILFDNISDLAYMCDAKGNVLFLNKIFEKLSGHKPGKFIGKSFAPLFDKGNLKKAIDIYTRTLKGESPTDEIYFKDTRVLCEYKNIPLRNDNGNIIGVIGIARDITERKRTEKMLLESSEEKYHILANSTKAISWICDVSTWQFTFVGAYAETLLGYRIEEWYQEDFWQNHIHPDDREQTINYCVTSTRRLEDHEFEYRMIASDGQIIWIYDIAKVTHSKGEPIQL
ncbi:MAG: PAS domain-containing protein, partial [Planctomycetota bacterium]